MRFCLGCIPTRLTGESKWGSYVPYLFTSIERCWWRPILGVCILVNLLNPNQSARLNWIELSSWFNFIFFNLPTIGSSNELINFQSAKLKKTNGYKIRPDRSIWLIIPETGPWSCPVHPSNFKKANRWWTGWTSHG